jgi:dTDP-glucose pyrophosphorylase
MAGEGKRFKNKGFKTPKPLILVNGTPMVIKALKSLPKAHKNILIVRKDHLDINKFTSLLNENFDNNLIIEIDNLTDGQASTCLIAEKHIPDDSILNIGACDVGFEYNHSQYLKKLKFYDSFVWTYRNNQNVINNPNMYGWIKLKENEEFIEYVSCKKPVSENLLNDHVVSGTFTFKKAKDCFDAIKKMIENNDRVNGEYYLDTAINYIKKKSTIFEIKKFHSWGTPDELNFYEKI